jgi:dipeptidyl aminopeptidase/acylaminoacyl peptidase
MNSRHWITLPSRLLVVLAALPSAALSAATPPSIDQIVSLQSVSRPEVSPDGRHVVYEKSEADWNENAYVTQLWLANVDTGRSVQLTRGKKSSDNALWSPDGRWVAFLTEREPAAVPPLADSETEKAQKQDEAKPDSRQIWLISPAGGEAWQLSKHGAKIDAFRWSDDSTRIAFTAPAPEAKAAKDRKERYGEFEVFEEDYVQNQLWVIELAPAESSGLPRAAVQITNDPGLNVGSFAWSPDRTAIAFAGTPNPLLAFAGEADLYLAELKDDRRVSKVVGLPGPDTNPRFSPDGKRLAFNTALASSSFYHTNRHIAVVSLPEVRQQPATKVGDVTDLTGAFDEDATLVDWNPYGIYFRAQQRTCSHLFRLDADAQRIVRVTPADPFFLGSVALNHAGTTAAYIAQDANHLAEVFVATLPRAGQKWAAKRLTDMTAQVAGFPRPIVELVTWKSSDGAEIEGVLHKPADFDPTKKYPLFVLIHGGPTGVSRPVLSVSHRYYPVAHFLAQGVLILEPNYRGSAGYGEKFRSLNVRNLGVGDMWDVMSGVDALIAKGRVDESRLGAMGWSQGGYISAFLATNTRRFKAISAGAGISDWMTYYVNTDITPFTRQYLQATPWDDPEIYARTSPMTNIKQARTPTLIQTGDRDKRVPPPNSFQLYRGLRDVGVPTRLLLYHGFGHSITKPKSNRALLQHNLDWFNHHVFGEPLPAHSPLRGLGSKE